MIMSMNMAEKKFKLSSLKIEDMLVALRHRIIHLRRIQRTIFVQINANVVHMGPPKVG